MRIPRSKEPIHIGKQILLNVGFDATPQDCEQFVTTNYTKEVGNVTEEDLNEWRHEWERDLNGVIPHSRLDIIRLTCFYLCRSQAGIETLAARLVGSVEGRKALREAMKALPIEGLQEMLGL